MKNRFSIIFAYSVIALALSVAGCTPPRGEAGETGTPVRIGVDTRAEIDGSVRLIVFAGGRLVLNRHVDAPEGNMSLTLYPGTYDFVAIVNELPEHTGALRNVAVMADIEAVRLTSTQLSGLGDEASLVCVGRLDDVVIGVGDTGRTITIPVTRAASRMSVRVRNKSAGDSFSITAAALRGVPVYSSLLPKTYDGTLAASTGIWSGATAIPRGDEYTEVVTGWLMPEYLPAAGATLPTLRLTADYTMEGGSTVTGTLFDMTLPDKFVRGTHYTVYVTVREIGGADHYLAYTVEKWDNVTSNPGDIDIGDNIYVHWADWAPGTYTEDGGRTARVRVGESVTMQFTLSQPLSGVWTAQLSNTADFYFDEVTGERGGVTWAEHIYRIVVRPRGDRPREEVSTELYITVFNGLRDVELELTGDGKGPGNRYVIKQIPML
jgi:hypothetical protein